MLGVEKKRKMGKRWGRMKRGAKAKNEAYNTAYDLAWGQGRESGLEKPRGYAWASWV